MHGYWDPRTSGGAFWGPIHTQRREQKRHWVVILKMCAAHVQDTYITCLCVDLLPRFLGVPRFTLSLYTEKYVNVGTPPRWRVHSMGPRTCAAYVQDTCITCRFVDLLPRFLGGTKIRTLSLYREICKCWYPPTMESAFYGTPYMCSICTGHVHHLSICRSSPALFRGYQDSHSLYIQRNK
jgi:hypothetical protein